MGGEEAIGDGDRAAVVVGRPPMERAPAGEWRLLRSSRHLVDGLGDVDGRGIGVYCQTPDRRAGVRFQDGMTIGGCQIWQLSPRWLDLGHQQR